MKTFKRLGIWFSKDPDESTRLNYDTRLDKIKTILQIWNQRSLSWKGRIMIIKTLILPQVTHLFSMTFTPQNFLVKLDKLIFSFLWRDKPPRIKRDTIIASIEDGGLKMTDIHAFHQAQKVVCMKNLILEGEKVLNLLLTVTGVQKIILKHKLTLEYLNQFSCDPFHKQLLECWFSIKSRQPERKNTILNEYIFLNRFITVNNTLIWPKFLGLNHLFIDLKIHDILDANNNFCTPAEFEQKFNCSSNFLNFYSMLDAVPKIWKLKINAEPSNFCQLPDFSFMLDKNITTLNKITSKKVYWGIVNNTVKPPSVLSTWVDLFPFLENFNWQKIYTAVNKISKEPYLQSFQYKLINRTINCRYNLHKWKLLATSKCHYCQNIDTIEHHFYFCQTSRSFWNRVSIWLHKIIECFIDLSVCEVLFGIVNYCFGDRETFDSLNLVILLGKWYINACKINEKTLLMSPFISLVKDKLKILKMNYTLTSDLKTFHERYGRLDTTLL